MKIVVSLITIYIVSFLLLLLLIYNGEKKELEKEKANFLQAIVAALTLAIIPTVVLAFIIFALAGSTNVVNVLFSLQIGKNELVIMAISFFVYLFFVDGIIEMLIKMIVGKNRYHFISPLIHILIFYMIGLIIGVNHSSSFLIALGVALIILLIELLYNKTEKNKA